MIFGIELNSLLYLYSIESTNFVFNGPSLFTTSNLKKKGLFLKIMKIH